MRTGINSIRRKNYARSTFAAALLALSVTGAKAAEAPLTPAELAYGNAVICHQNNVPVTGPNDTEACRTYLSKRPPALTDAEKATVIGHACFERHKANHSSFYEACKSQLTKQYSAVSIAINPNKIQAGAPTGKTNETTALGSCAKGAAVAVGGTALLQFGALVLDFMGCAGLCSATVATVTIPSIPAQVAVGCTAGVATHAVDAITSDTSGGQTPIRPRTYAPK